MHKLNPVVATIGIMSMAFPLFGKEEVWIIKIFSKNTTGVLQEKV